MKTIEVTHKGTPLTLLGTQLKVGDDAPKVWLKPKEMGSYQVGGKKDKIQLISSVPSMDTRICATQTKHFNQIAAQIPEIEIIVVSVDLPSMQSRVCSMEGIKNLTVVSDCKNREFGNKYGLLIDTPPLDGLLTRAVIIVDRDGKIAYQEICDDIDKEPDYDTAMNVVRVSKIRNIVGL